MAGPNQIVEEYPELMFSEPSFDTILASCIGECVTRDPTCLGHLKGTGRSMGVLRMRPYLYGQWILHTCRKMGLEEDLRTGQVPSIMWESYACFDIQPDANVSTNNEYIVAAFHYYTADPQSMSQRLKNTVQVTK